jgi:hypothetical protein
MLTHCKHLRPVFQTREILRRIQILEFVHWITDPDPDPVGGVQDANKKQVFFAYYLL